MSQLSDRVRTEILSAIDSDKLLLPTLPEVALRVREVAEDPDASIDKLVSAIGHDASLTVRIIKVANSPLLRASRQIDDLKMALMRLGIEFTCNLATGLAMEQMFQATSDMIDKRLREVWSHSSEVAGICHVLCLHHSGLKADKATLAGLVHKIGVLPILTYAEDYPSLLRDSMTLDTIIDELHPIIGEKILKTWDFPEELLSVPSQYLNFTRELNEADYSDIVTVAMLQSYMGSNHPMSEIDYSTVTAFTRLGLDSDMQSADAEDLSEEMAAATSLLMQDSSPKSTGAAQL
ncbi:MAG: HDOD domain-containing protein [Cellvibrionaceae bacterium]